MANVPKSAKPRRLGRGLTSLIGQPVPIEPPAPSTFHTEPPPSDEDGLVHVPVRAISPSPHQPRRSMDDSALAALADSIRRSGVIQPIIVRLLEGSPGRRYELVAGERRWRAATRAGLESVPALVRDLSDEECAEWALVENVQREDLNPIERAWALRHMAERFGVSHADLAARIGVERPTVSNLIRLTELEPEIGDLIARGRLSIGHAKALLSLEPGAARQELASRAASESWTVRKLEQEARRLARRATAAAGAQTSHPAGRLAGIASLERQLGEHLGTKVTIRTDGSGVRGRLIIEFYGLDHFDGLLARLGVDVS